MSLKNIKIGMKLFVGFCIILILTLLTGFVGYRSLQIVNESSENSAKLGKLNVQMLEARRQEKNFDLRGFKKFGSDTKNSVEKLKDICSETFRQLDVFRKQLKIQQEIDQTDSLKTSLTGYLAAFEKYVTVKTTSQDSSIINSTNNLMVENAREFHEGIKKMEDAFLQKKAQSISRANLLILLFVIFSVLFSVIVAITITRSITTGIKKGVEFSVKVANGDLSASIELDRADEIGVLAKSLTKMSNKLNELVQQIIDGANNLSSASYEISSGAQQLSQGASEQASSIEQVSSSIEEMAANIQQNSENAAITEKIATSSNEGIIEGYNTTKTMVESMQKTAEKIIIINDIAFQTNILALNAAVEAARAGEHGRGFAVVSTEVRKLAERSKIAANEINELTTEGVVVAGKAGKKLKEIVPEMEKTVQLVKEITASSMEQNAGAEQINLAIQQLNQVTQQNAAASEELATASEQLAGQAEQLKGMVAFFKTTSSNFKESKKQYIKNKKEFSNKESKAPLIPVKEPDLDLTFEHF